MKSNGVKVKADHNKITMKIKTIGMILSCLAVLIITISSEVFAATMTVTKAPGSNVYADLDCNQGEGSVTGVDSIDVTMAYDLNNKSIDNQKQVLANILLKATSVRFGYNMAIDCGGAINNSSKITAGGMASGEVSCGSQSSYSASNVTYYQYQEDGDTFQRFPKSSDQEWLVWENTPTTLSNLCECLASENCFSNTPSGSPEITIMEGVRNFV